MLRKRDRGMGEGLELIPLVTALTPTPCVPIDYVSW